MQAVIAGAVSDGSKVLGEIARAAITRLLLHGPAGAMVTGDLLDPTELAELATALAAARSTAELTGRALLRDFANRTLRAEASLAEAIVLPAIRQETPWSCGTAVLRACGFFFGVGPAAESDWRALLGTDPQAGTRPAELLAGARAIGLDAGEASGLSLDDLERTTAAGCPVLCPIQRWGGGHWVVVTGVDQAGVHVMDPVSGNDVIPAAEWLTRWQDTDADGRPFVRYGIAVRGPSLHESRLLEDLASPVQPLPPEQAVAYFTGLTPRLRVDPQRFGADQRRDAFTLAAATSKQLLGRVQGVISDRLRTGDSIGSAPRDIDELLADAGVSPRNPQYAEMVFRTNAMDAYNVGLDSERMAPDVVANFPVWKYSGIKDGRQGKDHEPHFGLYYPAAVAFATVRGDRVFNCRCTPIPISKYQWKRLKDGGARIADGYADVPAIAAATPTRPAPVQAPPVKLRTEPIRTVAELDQAMAGHSRGVELQQQIAALHAQHQQALDAARKEVAVSEALNKLIWEKVAEAERQRAAGVLTAGQYEEQIGRHQQTLDAINDKWAAARASLGTITKRSVAAAHDLMAAPSPIDVIIRTKTQLRGEMRANVGAAQDFVAKVLNQAGIPNGHDVELTTKRKGSRASASWGGRNVNIATDNDTGTIVHELGHTLEFRHPGILDAARALLAKRTAGQPLQKLKDLYPNSRYRPDEVVRLFRSDAFKPYQQHYIGKDYGTGATEVISMGLEKLYNDPLEFAAKDPEYFRFMLGILDGHLRTEL